MISKRALDNSKKYIGVHHDYVTIIDILDETDRRHAQMYLCRCDCGKEFKSPTGTALTIKSCGCKRKKESWQRITRESTIEKYKSYEGIHHDYMTILKLLDEKDNRNRRFFLCRCDCGKEFKVQSDRIFRYKSCGCLIGKHIFAANKKDHGSSSRLYIVWYGMIRRCYNEKNHNYSSYGGRGIGVCPEWRNDFNEFERWANETDYDPLAENGKCTLERIDPDKDYCPSNCIWTDMKKQNNNRRNNRVLTLNGERHTMSEWADITGLSYRCIWHRLERGWDVERALTEPPRG